jgi:hypothetical protein
MRKPVRVDPVLTKQLNEDLRSYGISVPGGFKLYVTDTRGGRCSKKNMNITVPVWAMKLLPHNDPIQHGEVEYPIYYACHEIAHILAPPKPAAPMRPGQRRRNPRDIHGAHFMAAFMEVCPNHLHYLELGYKPSLAAAAGIRSNK